MKVASLFDLVNDAKLILDFFERVESPEQMVSRLERLKRQGTTELLESLADLRSSIDNVMMDTLEMSALTDDDDFLDGGDEPPAGNGSSDDLFDEKSNLGSDLSPEDLADLGISDENENEISPETPAPPEDNSGK